jgi:hypothetical protein
LAMVVTFASHVAPLRAQSQVRAHSSDAISNELATRLIGTWDVSIIDPNMAFVESVITFALDGGNVEGHSYNGGASVVSGWLERSVVRATSSIFENGALLHITQVTAEELTADTTVLFGRHRDLRTFRAVYANAAGATLLRCAVFGDTLAGVLLRKGLIVGMVCVTRSPGSSDRTSTNYAALLASALDTLRQRMYDPTFEQTSAYQDFASDVTELGAEAAEDADVLMKYFRLRDALPFSHCGLYRSPVHTCEPPFTGYQTNARHIAC